MNVERRTSHVAQEGPDLLPAFLAVCDRLDLPAGGAVLIAVSGGADSMALWDLAARARRWPVVVYHLDHGLRTDAHRDAELIRQRAAALAADGLGPRALVCERCDIPQLAVQWHCSLETAGRRQRYARLAAVAGEQGAALVLTAHHRDDQAETVLFNLLRGAGPTGQAGIPERRPLAPGIAVVRPLLAFDRAALRAHLAARGLAWCEDATNTDQGFTRNWLRRTVLPVLEGGAPGFATELAAFAGRQRGALDGEASQVEGLWQRALGPDDLQISGIIDLPERLRLALWRRLLLHLLLPMARRHLRRIDDLLHGAPGRRLALGRWFLVRRDQAIAWEPVALQATLPPLAIPGPGTYHRGQAHLIVWSEPAPEDPHLLPGEACLAEGSCRFPLVWRAPRAGERWISLGAPGSQTVARWLANQDVPLAERRATAVLADADGVVWIPGHTIAERCRVRLETRLVVRLMVGGDAVAVRD